MFAKEDLRKGGREAEVINRKVRKNLIEIK